VLREFFFSAFAILVVGPAYVLQDRDRGPEQRSEGNDRDDEKNAHTDNAEDNKAGGE
jgi:hypothetical protein